jgi:glutamate 5-kinase
MTTESNPGHPLKREEKMCVCIERSYKKASSSSSKGQNKMREQPQRIVVKIGSSTLTNSNATFRYEQFRRLTNEIAQLVKQGFRPLIVSSGAIAAGFGILQWPNYPLTIPEKQAAASVGQGELMYLYRQFLAYHRLSVAQILLTQEDFHVQHRYINMCNTFDVLFQQNVVPIVNENDTVAVEEIKVGDNDTLGALVATVVNARLYIMLSDVDGLYTANPNVQTNARPVSTVEAITPEIEAYCGEKGSQRATGGMKTKLKAAKIATAAGTEVVIANGAHAGILSKILRGDSIGTRFLANNPGLSAKKIWLAFGSKIAGRITINYDAAYGLTAQGKGLLASDVLDTSGDFTQGSIVSIHDPDSQEIGRGLSRYASVDLRSLEKEAPVKDTTLRAAHYGSVEVIHQDELVIYPSCRNKYAYS